MKISKKYGFKFKDRKDYDKKKRFSSIFKKQKKIWDKRYYIKHKEELRKQSLEYYKKNKKIIFAKTKIYKLKNRERINAWTRRWNFLNRDKKRYNGLKYQYKKKYGCLWEAAMKFNKFKKEFKNAY